jgi:hypothetical protein
MATSYAETVTDSQPYFADAREHAAAVERALSGETMRRASFHDAEAYAEQEGREWTRRWSLGRDQGAGSLSHKSNLADSR